MLEGAAAAYFHDDHLVLLALGGLYDVFSQSRKARRSYANDCGLFALADLMRTFPTLEAARYAVAVALRLCTTKDQDVATLAGVATTCTIPGLADALRACVDLSRACARACACDGLREVEVESAPAPAPSITEGHIEDDIDERASQASREERLETLKLATRAAHAFLSIRAAKKTGGTGLDGDACASLVEECTSSFEQRAHDLNFDEPCRVASQLLALGFTDRGRGPLTEWHLALPRANTTLDGRADATRSRHCRAGDGADGRWTSRGRREKCVAAHLPTHLHK